MKKILLSAAALALSLCASALNQLPRDPEVRTGTLPNGLTYYLRHNGTPASQADFYIAMRVGSVNEEENQRGLAHFLEHMCFNGTRHFPGNSVITYLESLGVKFGANLNAYTSTDETVYNICEVPTTRSSALDSCMLILRDWSGDLNLNAKDIDEERGVIKGEWRQRMSQASSRLLEKALPELYPGSIYGKRMPIGSMDVVENFKHKELRNYYKQWYHPLNQCVVVVGDIDLDRTENEIKRLWSDVKLPKGATAFQLPDVPSNAAPVATVQTDPEQSASTLSMFIKHESTPDSLDNTIASMRNDIIKYLIGAMLAERITEVENAEGSPVTATAVGDRKFMLSRGQEALMLRTPVKSGRAADAVTALATELKRAARHGFLDSELQRAKIDARADMEKKFAERNSVTNTQYAKQYVRHYLDGGPLLSADQEHKMMRGVIGQVTLDDCNRYIASVVTPEGKNVVMMAYLPQTDKTEAAQLTEAYNAVDPGTLEAYVDRAVSGSILENEPTAGTVTNEQELPQFGAQLWTLSNGIKVYVRPSHEQADRIIITGYSPGGFSQNYNPALAPDYKMANDVLAVSRSGQYSADDLRRLLVGRRIKASIAIDNMNETLMATSSRADLADAFRLLHLKATDLRRDDAAFARLIDNNRSHLSDNRDNPTFAMGDSIHAYVYNRHPLGLKLTAKSMDSVDYDRILDLYRDRFGDMSDFAFFITGDFDADSVRSLVSRYIASLPTAGRMETPNDIDYRYGTTPQARFTMPMQTPQSIVYSFYHAPCEFTLHNRLLAQITGTLVQDLLREDLRERRGWTYGVKTHIGLNAGYNGSDPTLAIMPVYIRVAPENASETFAVVDSTVRSMANETSIRPEALAKTKEYLSKNYAQAIKDNSYWESVMRVYHRFGIDMNSGYLAELESVTPASVSEFARKVLLPAQRMQLEMSPEE
ncbi:MAG: insulinase family protein [Firmicutes bacterium]|nr:insulinase family protein [Bacillota bacterium]MCM1477811.1 insulinase family protein [Bacteroides sp.]